jgi:uncharacterized protein (DUF1330 family)
MLYITQLVYINNGQEAIFNEFEALAIPLIAKYGGALLLRCRPGHIIEASIESPFEIHFISFPSQSDFDRFKADDTRLAFLHLKELSVRASFLVSGIRI